MPGLQDRPLIGPKLCVMHHHRAYEGKIPFALYNTLDLYAGIFSFKTSVIIISGFGNAKGGTKVFTHAKPKDHH